MKTVILSLGLLFASLLFIGMPDSVAAQAPSGEYEIKARHSGKCLDVPGSSRADGTDVIQYTCNRTTNQTWKIYEGPPGYYTIRAKHSDKCLDVPRSSTENGAGIIQFQCYYTQNQQWEITDLHNGYYEIRARHSGKCLDITGSGTGNGVKTVQFQCYRTHNQQWELRYLRPVSETVQGTSGDDEIFFGYDSDQMRLKVLVNGRPLLYSKSGRSFTIDGGAGNDVIKALENTKIDEPRFDGLGDLDYDLFNLIGGSGNDHIEGTPGVDHIRGGDHDDYLVGKGGNDIIEGGSGNDVISGWGGDDWLYGGEGDDFLIGDQGDDHLFGEADNDILVGATDDDEIDGGSETDMFHCRRADLPTLSPYDGADHSTDCGDTRPRSHIERTQERDPYEEWAYMFYFNMVDDELMRIQSLTTSSTSRLLSERSSGASILMQGGDPLHTVHKQYGNTCGPSSLSMIVEYLGLADRSRRLQLPRDLSISSPTLIFNRTWISSTNVDVGYYLSTEHIMYEGYHYRYHARTLPDDYLDARKRLDTADSDETGSFKEIDYPIGNVHLNSALTGTVGPIQQWLISGPGVGTVPTKPDIELSHIANKYVVGYQDAMPYNINHFADTGHIKSIIRAFIDHAIPLLADVESGGHFNVIMGYKESGGSFYIYMADPLDGWGRPYYSKPMRWRKILLTDDVTRSGLLSGLMVFNHANTDNGCASTGWARAIDEAYHRNDLCGHVSSTMVNTPYQLQLINVECLDALEPRDQLMISVNGQDVWNNPRDIDNNGTLGSPRNISLEGLTFDVLGESRVAIKLEEVDPPRTEALGHSYIDVAQIIRDHNLGRRLECNINNIRSSHYVIEYRVVENPG